MCQKCLDAVKAAFPEMPEAQYGDLLMGATCYPFGSPEQVAQNIAELRGAGIVTLDGALGYAARKMDEAMASAPKEAPK
jgi:hypothetical protein